MGAGILVKHIVFAAPGCHRQPLRADKVVINYFVDHPVLDTNEGKERRVANEPGALHSGWGW